jgi:hypothetical protein
MPAAAANITASALSLVFDIPENVKDYGAAVDQVFGEISSTLSQFRIYRSMESLDPTLVKQVHLVLVCFVKLCAHVVKYRQGRKRYRFLKQVQAIFDDDTDLAADMEEFKRVLQQQRDVEGTITLAVAVETKHDVALLLEKSIIFGKLTEETNLAVQDIQKGVQAFKDDAARTKTLSVIRDALGVPTTVRLDSSTTQTCTGISEKCVNGTGTWIWTNEEYNTWVGPKNKSSSHVLVLSGPPSSGKTIASALITKRLEERKDRTYVAHYFFPAGTKKSEENRYSVQSALKYMAFQIARVDSTVQKALGKVCGAGSTVFRNSGSLDSLWSELKIGTSGSGATYYLVFDGLENLTEQQLDSLLAFLFGPRLSREAAGRVRILVSGTDEQFANRAGVDDALRIRMEDHNSTDMRVVVKETLNERGILPNPRPNSDQQKAKEKIIEKLPDNAGGSYSRLQLGMDDVMRLLSTRSAIRDLDRMLDRSTISHKDAIKNLQRSLLAEEIGELNELLKWVLFSSGDMTIEELEAAMVGATSPSINVAGGN